MSPTAKAPPQDPWRPDSRWALPAVLSVWIWTLGWLPVWAARWGEPFEPWLMVGFGFVAAGVGTWRARTIWIPSTYGDSLREQGTILAVLTGAAVGWFLYRAGYTSPWAQTPLLLLMAAVAGVWWAALVTVAPKHAAAEAERGLRLEHMSEAQIMRALLDQSDMADVKVLDHVETRAGWTTTLGPDPAYPRPPKIGDVVRNLDNLAINLAMYWRNRDGTVLEGPDIRLEEVSLDRWYLHTSTKHVLRENVPFRLAEQPHGFNLPLWLGLYEDGEAMKFTIIGRHLWLVGVTGGGKSVILNNIIARTLECRDEYGDADALVWVCGVNKIVPLVYPWLVPWFEGRTAEPAIDMVVGEHVDDVLTFLKNVFYLAKDRNARNTRRSKLQTSSQVPGIVVVVEEAQMFLAMTQAIAMEDEGADEFWSGGRLVHAICSIARSAGISIILVTQAGLVDALGSYGSEIIRNLQLRACTVTMADSDGRFALPALPSGVDTTQLRDHSMYLQVGIGENSRAMPGKAAKIDEDDVPPVATRLAERRAHLSGRDLEAFNHESGWYENRWAADRVPVLVEAARDDDEAPGGNGFDWPPDRPAQPVVVEPEPLGEDEPRPLPGLPPVEPVSFDVPGADVAVHTDPDGPDPYNVPLTDEEERALNDELTAILGRPPTVVPAPAPEPPKGSPISRLPTDADIENLARLARRMEREAEEMIAARDAEDAARPKSPPIVLPQPLAAVIAHLDALDDAPSWIATADLAAEVLGEDIEHGPVKLGQMLARNARTAGVALNATEPRDLPDGRRLRGFLVADLYRAAVAIRDAQREQR
jgi:hypothetical protein